MAIAAFGLLFVTSPYVANAAGLITGAQIKNNTVTGADVKESALATVPSAASLAPLKSGHTESGAFAVGGALDAASSDYVGWGITFPQRLAKPIPDAHIIDTVVSPHPTLCPGAGRAARGYLLPVLLRPPQHRGGLRLLRRQRRVEPVHQVRAARISRRGHLRPGDRHRPVRRRHLDRHRAVTG